MMDNTTQLLIRACRSRHPHKRVRSVYHRFYLTIPKPEHENFFMCGILINIVEQYCPMKPNEVIRELAPNYLLNDKDKPYYDRALKMLISKIRLSNAERFKGLTTPAKFRNTISYRKKEQFTRGNPITPNS